MDLRVATGLLYARGGLRWQHSLPQGTEKKIWLWINDRRCSGSNNHLWFSKIRILRDHLKMQKIKFI
jgi:hypothetical protein